MPVTRTSLCRSHTQSGQLRLRAQRCRKERQFSWKGCLGQARPRPRKMLRTLHLPPRRDLPSSRASTSACFITQKRWSGHMKCSFRSIVTMRQTYVRTVTLSQENLLSARVFTIWKAQNLAMIFRFSSPWCSCPAAEQIFDAMSSVIDTTAEQILPPVVWTWQHESRNAEYGAVQSVQVLLGAGSGTPVSVSSAATQSSVEGTYSIGFTSTRALERGKCANQVQKTVLLHVSSTSVQRILLS